MYNEFVNHLAPLYGIINFSKVTVQIIFLAARAMLRCAVFFVLSTTATQTTNGLAKFGHGKQMPPLYHGQKNNHIYDPYKTEKVDDYNAWKHDGEKQNFNDEELPFASSADDDEKDSRRLFDWISRLFQSTTPKETETTVTTTESSYRRELKDRIFLRALHHNLTEVLFKLSAIEKHVSLAMQQKEEYTILTRGKPEVLRLDDAFYYRERLKRDVNAIKADAASAVKAENATKNPVTEKLAENTTIDVLNANATECPCNVTSGRRAGTELGTPTDVKNKLLLYLQESFQEIKTKIMSLKSLKQMFSDNTSFKIGYILANIDTLEISVLNLKNNMERNKEGWEDGKILELYDTLKVSNQAVSGLIESLKMYLEKLPGQPRAKPE